MSKPRILVHIGVPKSGTTSLQFGAFPAHPEIRYIGKPFYDAQIGYEASLATAQLCDSLWKQDDFEFDAELARHRFELGIRPRMDAGLTVLSEEGFSQASATDRHLTAQRLATLYKGIDCKILITIREQKSALHSGYKWVYTRRLTSLGFGDWLEWCRSYSSYYGCYNDFPLRQYCYARLVETYVELFGRERVLVLPMEMLAREQAPFFSRLEEFASISHFWGTPACPPMPVENLSPGRLGIRYQRLVKKMQAVSVRLRGNPAVPSEALEEAGIHSLAMRLLARIDTPMRPMTVETAAWLDDYYRADNASLAELTGLNLVRYGYAL